MPYLTTKPYPFVDHDELLLAHPAVPLFNPYKVPKDELLLTHPEPAELTVIYPPADLLVARSGGGSLLGYLDYYQQTSEDVFERIESWVNFNVPYIVYGLTATFNRNYIFCATRNLGEKVYWFKRVADRQYIKMPQFSTSISDVLDCILSPDEKILVITGSIGTEIYSFNKADDTFTNITSHVDFNIQEGKVQRLFITADSKYFYFTFNFYVDECTTPNMTQIVERTDEGSDTSFSLITPCLVGTLNNVTWRGSYGAVAINDCLITHYVEGIKIWVGSPEGYALIHIIDVNAGATGIKWLAVSPDGQHLAAASSSGVYLNVYSINELISGRAVTVDIDVRPSAIQYCVAYSRDGNYLAVCGADLSGATQPDYVSIYKRDGNAYQYIRPLNRIDNYTQRVLWL